MHIPVGSCAKTAALAAVVALGLSAQAPPGRGGPGRGRGGGGLLAEAGAADKHVVDPAAADRGKKTYIAECITCHGGSARGTTSGPDLVRSLVVLHDRYGSELGPFLKKGHPTQSTPSANFTKAQIEDLSHFIHQRVGDTLRGSPIFHSQNVLTGDPKAGQAYFNGAGGCSGCHSPTGDLAGIGSRLDPIDMQQRFLFPKPIGFAPRGSKPVTVTVTPPSGPPVSGVLDKIDDFNVSLRDSEGQYHAWTRNPSLKVEVKDPYAVHAELLDKYTDKNMHDVVAYLETLK
jgi:cytochrome c oxidase cbb3-type subunit 3